MLRRAVAAGRLSDDVASIAYADMLDLDIAMFDFEPFAERIWALRNQVSAYDAWYVALAEGLEAPLATLDGRLASAQGPRCRFLVPQAS